MQGSKHDLKWQNLFHYWKIHNFGPIFVTNVFHLFDLVWEKGCLVSLWDDWRRLWGVLIDFFDMCLFILGLENSDEKQIVF